MKKLISLLVVFAIIMSHMIVATPVSAEEVQNTVTALGNKDLYANVPFSNGYNGFCLNDLLKAPEYGHEYTIKDTSEAKRIDNGVDVSQQLKLLFTQCFEQIFIKTDQGYIMTEDNVTINGITYRPTFVVQGLIYYYIGSKNYTSIWQKPHTIWDSIIKAYNGPAIPDSGYQRTLENGDVITFDFMVMLSGDSATQNMFAYKFDVTPAGEVKPETVSATIKKVWDDADNQDGKRPESLTVTLSNGTEVTLNEANNWTATVTDLPKYADGEEIVYTWTEGNLPEGYTLTNSSVEGTVTTLTNSYTPETVSATIKKVWDDADNQDGKRPENLTVTLSNGTEVTLNEANNWTATVIDLPKYADGEEIVYTWTEGILPEGYTLTDISVDGTVTTLTNSYTPETVSATIKKVWDDADNQDGKRPESLTVTLSNGTEVTLNEANNWTATVTDLPKYDDGQVIAYTWTEGNLPEGYTLTNSSVEGTVTTLTNSYTPEKIKVSVKKIWNDAGNQNGIRPATVTVKLFADGHDTGKALVLNEENGWTGVFTDLAKKAAGNIIAYTVDEVNVPDGYEQSVGRAVETNTGIEITITNTLKEESKPDQDEDKSPEENKPTDKGDPDLPPTGDHSNLLLWFSVLFVSAVGTIVTTVLGKRIFRKVN